MCVSRARFLEWQCIHCSTAAGAGCQAWVCCLHHEFANIFMLFQTLFSHININSLWHIWKEYGRARSCQWVVIIIGWRALLETLSKSLQRTAVLFMKLSTAKWNSLFHKTWLESHQIETDDGASSCIVWFIPTGQIGHCCLSAQIPIQTLQGQYHRGSPEEWGSG